MKEFAPDGFSILTWHSEAQHAFFSFKECRVYGLQSLKDLSQSLNHFKETHFHYENVPIQIHWKFYHQKMAIFQIKNSDIFHISAQNIDCGYPLSNEYPQSMFLSRIKKNNVYPCKPQFYYIKVGFKGV